MTARFFCDSIPLPGQEALLDRDDSHHLVKVLRLAAGDAVDLVDGRGVFAPARLKQADARQSVVTVLERHESPRAHRVTVAFGVTKGAALDFIVHRLTEVGVHALVPLITDHSLAPKDWNAERWTRVLRETAKQCQERWLPELYAPRPLGAYLDELQGQAFAVCDEVRREAGPGTTAFATVLVGPEGGWSAAERGLFQAKGAAFVGLGQNRLRAETAALAAAVLAKRSLGEL